MKLLAIDQSYTNTAFVVGEHVYESGELKGDTWQDKTNKLIAQLKYIVTKNDVNVVVIENHMQGFTSSSQKYNQAIIEYYLNSWKIEYHAYTPNQWQVLINDVKPTIEHKKRIKSQSMTRIFNTYGKIVNDDVADAMNMRDYHLKIMSGELRLAKEVNKEESKRIKDTKKLKANGFVIQTISKYKKDIMFLNGSFRFVKNKSDAQIFKSELQAKKHLKQYVSDNVKCEFKTKKAREEYINEVMAEHYKIKRYKDV